MAVLRAKSSKCSKERRFHGGLGIQEKAARPAIIPFSFIPRRPFWVRRISKNVCIHALAQILFWNFPGNAFSHFSFRNLARMYLGSQNSLPQRKLPILLAKTKVVQWKKIWCSCKLSFMRWITVANSISVKNPKRPACGWMLQVTAVDCRVCILQALDRLNDLVEELKKQILNHSEKDLFW